MYSYDNDGQYEHCSSSVACSEDVEMLQSNQPQKWILDTGSSFINKKQYSYDSAPAQYNSIAAPQPQRKKSSPYASANSDMIPANTSWIEMSPSLKNSNSKLLSSAENYQKLSQTFSQRNASNYSIFTRPQKTMSGVIINSSSKKKSETPSSRNSKTSRRTNENTSTVTQHNSYTKDLSLLSSTNSEESKDSFESEISDINTRFSSIQTAEQYIEYIEKIYDLHKKNISSVATIQIATTVPLFKSSKEYDQPLISLEALKLDNLLTIMKIKNKFLKSPDTSDLVKKHTKIIDILVELIKDCSAKKQKLQSAEKQASSTRQRKSSNYYYTLEDQISIPTAPTLPPYVVRKNNCKRRSGNSVPRAPESLALLLRLRTTPRECNTHLALEIDKTSRTIYPREIYIPHVTMKTIKNLTEYNDLYSPISTITGATTHETLQKKHDKESKIFIAHWQQTIQPLEDKVKKMTQTLQQEKVKEKRESIQQEIARETKELTLISQDFLQKEIQSIKQNQNELETYMTATIPRFYHDGTCYLKLKPTHHISKTMDDCSLVQGRLEIVPSSVKNNHNNELIEYNIKYVSTPQQSINARILQDVQEVVSTTQAELPPSYDEQSNPVDKLTTRFLYHEVLVEKYRLDQDNFIKHAEERER